MISQAESNYIFYLEKTILALLKERRDDSDIVLTEETISVYNLRKEIERQKQMRFNTGFMG